MGFVQAQKLDTTGASVSFPAITVTAGNFLYVCIRAGSTNSIGISDNLGNTYTPWPAQSLDGQGNNEGGWYAKNITGGSCTITVTCTGGPSMRGNVIEWNGLDTSAPADQKSTPNLGSGTSFTSNSITTTAAAEVLFCFCATQNSQASFTAGTVGSGTGTIPANGNSTKTAIAYHHETSTGTYTGTISYPTSEIAVYGWIVSFKDSTGPPPSGGLKRNSSLNGLGASGPFFHDPLAA